MKHEIETQWMGKMQFNALVNGHTVVMDAPERVGGEDQGPIPKPFILSAVSGCTGMDVISLLRKQNKTIDDLSIKVSGEISKQAPIEYTSVHIVFELKGPSENKDAVLAVIIDSQEKYCGISSMLKKIMPVTYEVFYNGEKLYSSENKEANPKVA